jgi:uncharacterized protein YkwD
MVLESLLLASTLASVAGTEPIDSRKLEQKMVRLVNAEREARGILPLNVVPALADAARRHSETMAATGDVSHEAGGTEMEQRIRRAVPNRCASGENISKHISIDYAMGDLLGSPGHRSNLLNKEFTLIGIGIVQGKDQFLYITQDFAAHCSKPETGQSGAARPNRTAPRSGSAFAFPLHQQ